ncbi:PREDICTED: uncharacterized protein LOC108556633 isoform X2 [Nicrophorus vespilloides]|uniref:Uncharacterized protein LOC108556633 isoform X2 n=1 Tax=Nicrophorus vespilloides TaxID=110193 RepID=A0ABM1M157_NICVS|nr:PREDICTED: uncharacterized protein LOC108556633 isoform X2 [Nicrophorus vespilloides]
MEAIHQINTDLEWRQIQDVAPIGHKETEFSPLCEHQISYVRPNSVMELVDRNVKFQRLHGPKKNVKESIVPKRLFVIYENIEVLQPEENNIYSSIDKTMYKAIADKAMFTTKEGNKKELAGFIELKYLPESCMKPSSSVSSTSTSDSESVTKSDDFDDSVYNTIIDARTPKPLNDENRKNFGKSFIISTKVKNIVEQGKDGEPPKNAELFRYEYNLSSTVLMNHFKHKEFQYSLSEALGFEKDIVDAAMYNNTNVFYNILDEEENELIQWELIPAIEIDWPSDQTSEWYNCRRAMKDNNHRICQWPRKYMLEKLQDLKAFAIPSGCMFKRSLNERLNFEWELAFPLQEKYLEAKLGHVQLTIYFFFNTLFKTFIEPQTQQKGLLADHFRNLIFSECEKNCYQWPQLRLGKKILILIDILYNHLGKHRMPHYFVREKNLFQNIPAQFLRKAQETLNNIREMPVMHFLLAMRNLQYVNESFYPMPNLKRLYEILVEEKLTKQFEIIGGSTPEPVVVKPVEPFDEEADWETRCREEKRRKRRQAKLEAEEARKNKENLKAATRLSTDSIDLTWKHDTSNMDSNLYKIPMILEFFIDHFIDIAKHSLKLRDYNQSKLYLRQATLLSKVHSKDANHAMRAEDYLKLIEDLENKVDSAMEKKTYEKPSLPLRNSSSVHMPKTWMVNNISLKSDKLHKEYNSYEKKPIIKKERPDSNMSINSHEDAPTSSSGSGAKTITFKADVEVV